jgi:hypothetical protein
LGDRDHRGFARSGLKLLSSARIEPRLGTDSMLGSRSSGGDAMYCTGCGIEISGSSNFCPSCGAQQRQRTSHKQLTLSATDKKLAGVCGGACGVFGCRSDSCAVDLGGFVGCARRLRGRRDRVFPCVGHHSEVAGACEHSRERGHGDSGSQGRLIGETVRGCSKRPAAKPCPTNAASPTDTAFPNKHRFFANRCGGFVPD